MRAWRPPSWIPLSFCTVWTSFPLGLLCSPPCRTSLHRQPGIVFVTFSASFLFSLSCSVCLSIFVLVEHLFHELLEKGLCGSQPPRQLSVIPTSWRSPLCTRIGLCNQWNSSSDGTPLQALKIKSVKTLWLLFSPVQSLSRV